MKVIIDGQEYIRVADIPSAEAIARGIMESFWGDELPPGYSWDEEAKSLRVLCSDSLERDAPTVIEVTAAILKRMTA